MVAKYSTEYDTCTFCGEPVRHVMVSSWMGRAGTHTTSHVRSVRDISKRCRYDSGPEAGATARLTFPGDTC